MKHFNVLRIAFPEFPLVLMSSSC